MKKQNLIAVCLLLFALGVKAQTISTVAGNGTGGYSGDGSAAISAELQTPIGVSMDVAGNMYISDQHNNCIRKVNVSGTISTFAGSGTTFGFSGDGGAATAAKLYQPNRVAVDGSGNVYIIDQGNWRIRKVDLSGTITTFAGNGTSGFTGDGGAATAAQIVMEGIAINASGDLYIGASTCIRKVSASTGMISTIAGNPSTAGFSGDGGLATAAQFNNASDLVFDAAGNLYICDQARIRKINTSGIISTIAGNGTTGITGDGGPATAATIDPTGIAVDASGNIYFAQTNEQIIRKIDAAGTITKVAGNGSMGFSGDGGPATAAEFTFPAQVATDGLGNIYIADQNNQRIRKVSTGTSSISPIGLDRLALDISPNPASDLININLTAEKRETIKIAITNVVGHEVQVITAYTNTPTNVSLNVPAGVYFVTAMLSNATLCKTLIVK